MKQQVGTRIERVRAATEWVIPAAVALLLVQLAFRTWAAWSGWYLHDDLVFLIQSDQASHLAYLMEPYNGHLMPGGKLVFWLIGLAGSAAWWPAATYLVVGQAIASTACLWMLVTLFGRRWAILPPFMLYLFLPLSMPAYMWFVASTQQLPLQIVMSIAVAAWVRYLRGEGRRWLAVTTLALGGGMVFREKALLVLPVLVFLFLFYFTAGGLRDRVRDLRRGAMGLLCVVGAGAAYYLFYRARVQNQFTPVTPDLTADLARTMLGSTLSTGLMGGPWRWHNASPPNSYADPPVWAAAVSCLVIGTVMLYIVLRRRWAWPGLLLFTGYVAGTFLLVLSARGEIFGATLGSDMRFLSDIPIVLCLTLGLAIMQLRGAQVSSEPRESTLVPRAPMWLVAVLLGAVISSSIVSSVAYVRPWHNSEAKSYLHTLKRELSSSGRVDLADRVVPEQVLSYLFTPRNRSSFLAPLVSDNASFPDTASSLFVIADDGDLRLADISDVLESRPGRVARCGWKVSARGKTIPLNGQAMDIVWWVRIGYLATAPTTATVTAGEKSFDVSLRSGLNDLYLRVDGAFDTIRFDGLQPDVTVCVDTIRVGQMRPGNPA